MVKIAIRVYTNPVPEVFFISPVSQTHTAKGEISKGTQALTQFRNKRKELKSLVTWHPQPWSPRSHHHPSGAIPAPAAVPLQRGGRAETSGGDRSTTSGSGAPSEVQQHCSIFGKWIAGVSQGSDILTLQCSKGCCTLSSTFPNPSPSAPGFIPVSLS